MEPPPDLDEQIRQIRGLVATESTAESVGVLVMLLLARGNVALQADRDEDAGVDYRAAADLLASYADDALPVNAHTARLVWTSWAARARHEGRLDEALDAARRQERLWDEAVAVEREALAEVRSRDRRFAVVEVNLLRRLARCLVATGRPEEEAAALREALEVLDSPGHGVVPPRDGRDVPIRAEVGVELAALDSGL